MHELVIRVFTHASPDISIGFDKTHAMHAIAEIDFTVRFDGLLNLAKSVHQVPICQVSICVHKILLV